jgi:hypothetical protein
VAKGKKKAEGGEAPPARENMPTKEEFDSFFERLHEVNDRLDTDTATHRGDMNAIYEEGAKALGVTKEVVVSAYKKDRTRAKEEEKFKQADTRTRDSLLLVASAYGPDSPLGRWAAEMAEAAKAGRPAGAK